MTPAAYMLPHIRKEGKLWSIYRHYMPKGLIYLPVARGHTPSEVYAKYSEYINS